MNIKKCYAGVLACLRHTLGDKTAKKFDAWFRFGRKLNLDSPKTLADKVSLLSIGEYQNSELVAMCTDKYAVRQYVTDKGLGQILIPLAGGCWRRVEEINFTELPDRIMLKATHGCKMNYPIPDKRKLDVSDCRAQIQKWLDTTYGTYSMELHYARIQHGVYAEQLLEDGGSLIDYKIHCLNGKPQFILVCSDRKIDGDKRMAVTLDLFDTEWNPIHEVRSSGLERAGTGKIPKPICLKEMLEIAEILSKDFKFVRVDLYEHNGAVLFGELTFTPACGVFPNFSTEFIRKMGDQMKL